MQEAVGNSSLELSFWLVYNHLLSHAFELFFSLFTSLRLPEKL